jgi:HD-GYP domain-containing protein (c-di-GMP phosphodiesterase class II)
MYSGFVMFNGLNYLKMPLDYLEPLTGVPMIENPSEIQSLQDDFRILNDTLLKIMGDLSSIAHPLASSAVQDLSVITNKLQLLETGVSGHLYTGQRQLTALVGVGHVINSSLGLTSVLEEVMDSLVTLTHAERGYLMLTNSEGKLKEQVARGMDHVSLDGESFAISRTIVERVAKSGEPVLTTNAKEDPRFDQQLSIVEHNLRSILCVPLKLKDKVIGVIYVDNRVYTGLFQESDLDMLSAFADQAAVAIDNARLFDGLQLANEELKAAYDETIKGWALALELRDRETEGHTQRVTALTLVLAEKLGICGDELSQIKRGSLLHDIGKMAIPDEILRKPGELSLTERKFMELHPLFAKDMLDPIEFLHPAMDIPYCHHEKWDGSGYPRNLRGREIPFAARIFAVVDVWDALTSDRPYRAPMDPDEVRQIIREGSGKHFDPQVVDAFLAIKDLPVSQRLGDIQ